MHFFIKLYLVTFSFLAILIILFSYNQVSWVYRGCKIVGKEEILSGDAYHRYFKVIYLNKIEQIACDEREYRTYNVGDNLK